VIDLSTHTSFYESIYHTQIERIETVKFLSVSNIAEVDFDDQSTELDHDYIFNNCVQ
jgi:hypothetical protein